MTSEASQEVTTEVSARQTRQVQRSYETPGYSLGLDPKKRQARRGGRMVTAQRTRPQGKALSHSSLSLEVFFHSMLFLTGLKQLSRQNFR